MAQLHLYDWKTEKTPENVPFLFLHGLGGTGKIFRPIASNLEDFVRCLSPDQRGHGQSQSATFGEHFHASDYAHDLAETLDDLGIPQVFVVGHSMGVRSGLAFHSLYPEKAVGFVGVDIGLSGPWGGGLGSRLADFIAILPHFFETRTALKSYCDQHCPDPSIAAYLHAVSKPTTNAEGQLGYGFPFDHHALIQTISKANDAPLEDWVQSLQRHETPSFFLRGMNSKVWTKTQYEQDRNRHESSILHFQEWENCGHGLPFEQRARFVSFLKEIRSIPL